MVEVRLGSNPTFSLLHLLTKSGGVIPFGIFLSHQRNDDDDDASANCTSSYKNFAFGIIHLFGGEHHIIIITLLQDALLKEHLLNII